MESIENENSVTRKVYGRERSGGTDENGFLSNSMMINATNTVVKERIWISREASDLCFSLYPHWPARSSFSLYIQTLANSTTSKMTLMECGHPGIFVFMSQRVLRRCSQLRVKLRIQCSMPLVGLPFKCHQRRWSSRVVAGVLNEVRQSGHTRRIS